MKTAVIGGGISGLTAAYLLKQKGIDVTLFEKNSYPGGNIKSELINGYLVEHGPSSTLETSPLLNKLFEELGILVRKIYASEEAKKRYILKDGKLYALPMSPTAFLKTKLFSTSAKLRLLKEPFIKTKSNELETIAEFTGRRLGREFLDYAINPFVAGVFAGNPYDLNVKSAFPKLYELEQKYGSLIGGMIKSRKERKRRKEESKQSAKTFSFKNGLIELVNALYERTKTIFSLNTEVLDLRRIGGSYIITFIKGDHFETESFDSVILSIPAYFSSRLIRSFDNKLSEDLSNIYYPPVTVITTGFKNNQFKSVPDGFGFLVPEKENRKILGSLWNSSIFPGRAPNGYSLLTNFIGGSRHPELASES
ncbi:MAG TPA: protoporphyrinogen oxidase, partial [Ignavibacteria bacterium]